jgi:hypothetical protein
LFDEIQARAFARAAVPADDITLGPAREIQSGWYFALITDRIGSNGVVVNKRTGRVLSLGSGRSLERQLAMYDRGYQFARYDLVILAVHDMEATRRVVGKLPLRVVTPSYQHGQVWRVARDLTDQERRTQLDHLPCVFPALRLDAHIEQLEEARREAWFEFEALEFRPQWNLPG